MIPNKINTNKKLKANEISPKLNTNISYEGQKWKFEFAYTGRLEILTNGEKLDRRCWKKGNSGARRLRSVSEETTSGLLR